MSEKKVMFRTVSFGGFYKEDVIKYIEEQNYKFNQLTQSSKLEKEKLEEQVKSYVDAAEKSGVDAETAHKELSEISNYKAEIERLRLEVESKNAEIQNIKSRNSLLENEITSKRQEIEALKEDVKTTKSDNLLVDQKISTATKTLNVEIDNMRNKLEEQKVKIDHYDAFKETLAQLEIDSHIRAREISNKAEKDSEDILKQAQNEAEEIVERANQEIHKALEERDNLVLKTQEEIKEVTSRIAGSFDIISDQINVIMSATNASMNELLNMATKEEEITNI